MGQSDKLIQRAITSPQNLRFDELCTLCELFGMEKRRGKGSHVIYKYKGSKSYTLPIQNNQGKAVVYQVRQLLTWAKEIGFLKDFLKESEEE